MTTQSLTAELADLIAYTHRYQAWDDAEVNARTAEIRELLKPDSSCPDCGGPTENLVGGSRCDADEPCGWWEKW